MPQVAPITLNDGTANKIYQPTSLSNGVALFANRDPQRAAEWPKLSASAAPPSRAKGKGSVKSAFTVPVPVSDQDGCCVDKDTPTVIAFNVDVGVPSHATAVQITAALEQFRSWINSETFEDLVEGSGWY